MILFYSTEIHGNEIILSEEEHMHCTKVLRKKSHDPVSITDGKGNIYTCTISTILKNSTLCHIISSEFAEPIKPALGIAISPTKNADRLEWFVEKAVEIGISAIHIFYAHRTEKKTVNINRLNKILISAMKQSLNVTLPSLTVSDNIFTLDTIIHDLYQQKFIGYCNGPTAHIGSVIDKEKSSVLLIGPEGDFTQDEINFAVSNCYHPITLGPSRLRTETAGLAGLLYMK